MKKYFTFMFDDLIPNLPHVDVIIVLAVEVSVLVKV